MPALLVGASPEKHLGCRLVRAGATYYSGEFAVVDKRGMVHASARPLQLREKRLHLQIRRPVEEFRGVAGRLPKRVGLVVVSRYKPEAQWRPRQLSPGMPCCDPIGRPALVRQLALRQETAQ
jgi:hypothetical protein